MDNNIEALRAELLAAENTMSPQIRGLHDLRAMLVTGPLGEPIRQQIEVRERRRDLILTVLDDLRKLEADGYPKMDKAILPSDLFSLLHSEETDIDAAVAVFDTTAPATTLAVSLGAPAKKPL